jgi:hypothetical protein
MQSPSKFQLNISTK